MSKFTFKWSHVTPPTGISIISNNTIIIPLDCPSEDLNYPEICDFISTSAEYLHENYQPNWITLNNSIGDYEYSGSPYTQQPSLVYTLSNVQQPISPIRIILKKRTNPRNKQHINSFDLFLAYQDLNNYLTDTIYDATRSLFWENPQEENNSPGHAYTEFELSLIYHSSLNRHTLNLQYSIEPS